MLSHHNTLRTLLWAALMLLPVTPGFSALVLTNVSTVNVTPTSFSVIGQVSSPATPGIVVFTDAAGVSNLVGKVALQPFPLNSGSPQAVDAYNQRQSLTALRDNSKNLRLLQIKVSGLSPRTTYYYRLEAVSASGDTGTWPISGPLLSVTTPEENSFITQSRQLIIEVVDVNPSGRILTLANTNASYGLAAVVGDGAGTNQAFFNVSELFSLDGEMNYIPLGPQQFAVNVLGQGGGQQERYTLNFNNEFNVAEAQRQSLGQSYLALNLGRTVLQAGQTGVVAVAAQFSGGVTNLSFLLDLDTNRFVNLVLEPVGPAISRAAINPAGPNRFRVVLESTTELVSGLLANLRFVAASNQTSAMVHLLPKNIVATSAGGSVITNLFAGVGRVVIIGQQPILEAAFHADGSRFLVLYGNTGVSYALESSPAIPTGSNWTFVARFPMTNLTQVIEGVTGGTSNLFYRAYEFVANPAVLEARSDANGDRSLLLYGVPGTTQRLQSATSMSDPIVWSSAATVTFSNSFQYFNGLEKTNQIIFYRLQKQ